MIGLRDKEKAGAALFCLLAAALLLLLCSQCSPLYPINVWVDANCLMTVGRMMKAGAVLYRDVYEQKGPTLYLIHMLSAYISDNSFLGVYIFEVLALAAALYCAYRMMRLRLRPSLSLTGTVLAGACMLVSSAFSKGDSAEEFCLPLLMFAIQTAFEQYGRRSGPMKKRALFGCGLMAGLTATIKYTVLGLFVGLCIAEGIAAIREGGLVRALKSAGVFLAGMMIPAAVWIAYFAANGALSDFYTAYLYNNIFLYSAEGADAGVVRMLKDVLLYMKENALWIIPALLGGFRFLFLSGERVQLRLCLLAMALTSLLAVCFFGRLWPYCPLVLAPFAVLGLMEAMRFVQRCQERGLHLPPALLPATSCALALLLAWNSPNAFLRGESLDNLAQGRLSVHVPKGCTLLQYSHLDDGLYLASGALPPEKYFVRLNVDYDEMYEELDRYVAEGIPDYVLVSWSPLPEEFDRYQLIATDATYDDQNRINKLLYLYRRKDT